MDWILRSGIQNNIICFNSLVFVVFKTGLPGVSIASNMLGFIDKPLITIVTTENLGLIYSLLVRYTFTGS